MKKKIICSLLAVLLASSLAACSSSPTTDAESVTSSNEEVTPEIDPAVYKSLVSNLEDAFGDNYEVTKQANSVSVKTWYENGYSNMLLALSDYDAYKTWRKTLESLRGYSEKLYNFINEESTNTSNIYISLVSEKDHDLVMAEMANGVIVKDHVDNNQKDDLSESQPDDSDLVFNTGDGYVYVTDQMITDLDNIFGSGNYMISESYNCILIDGWWAGNAKEAQEALNNEQKLKEWNEMAESMRQLNEVFTQYASDASGEQIDISLAIVSDIDKTHILLDTQKGKIISNLEN